MTIDVNIVLIVISAITAIAAFIALVYKWFKNAVNHVSKDVIKATTEDYVNLIKSEVDILAEEMQKFIEHSQENNRLYGEALISLSRERINSAYNFFMKQKSIDTHSLYTLNLLYESYAKLGGNSHVGDQIKALKQLQQI